MSQTLSQPERTVGRRRPAPLTIAVLLLLAAGVALTISGVVKRRASSGAGHVVVSQQSRAFRPGALDIARGTLVRIVNDDGELQHHAYIASPQFSFDSGDQEPGTFTNVIFSVPGQFEVLCAIHPKMRLRVQVR